jgi:hypothetical protein
MSERSMLERIRDLAATEAGKGTAVVGLWVDWNGYRHLPARFTADLGRMPPRAPRKDVADALNKAWGKHGIATIVHRETAIRPDLAVDRTRWLVDELTARIDDAEHAGFADSIATNGPRHGHAVVVLADQTFTNDGQSPHDWNHGGKALATTILDPDLALPAGLSPLLEYDTDMQLCISQLEWNLAERWQLQEAADPASAKEALDHLCSAVVGKRDPASLRALVGIPAGPSRSAPLGTDERATLKDRISRDLSAQSDVIEPKRLGYATHGAVNWFLPVHGSVSASDGRLLLRCFGNPLSNRLSPESWAVSLLNNATPHDRKHMTQDPHLHVAVQTLISLYAAMRFANMFAHRGEYEFDLPTYLMEGLLKNEVRHLERVAYAWRP